MNEKSPIFNLYPPKNKFIGVLSIPHSGEDLPSVFTSFLTDNWDDLIQDIDYRVHELIDIEQLQEAGIAVIKSNIIRVAIDLNRTEETALLNWKQNTKNRRLVLNEPDMSQAKELLGMYYTPYFEMIKTLINELKLKLGHCNFVDLHSMPGVAEEYHLKINPKQDKLRPDFCVSDQTGLTCTQEFIDYIVEELRKDYADVKINAPYFGGHITQHVHKEFENTNNIQIEINRAIYMDENTKELNPDFIKKLKPALTRSLINLFNQYE